MANRYAYINPQGQQVEITADTPESALSAISGISDPSSGVMYLGPAGGTSQPQTEVSDGTMTSGDDGADVVGAGPSAGMNPEDVPDYTGGGSYPVGGYQADTPINLYKADGTPYTADEIRSITSGLESAFYRGSGSTPYVAPKSVLRSVYGSTGGSQNVLGEGGYTGVGGIGEGGLPDDQKKREEYLASLSEEKPKTKEEIAAELTTAAKDQISSLTEYKNSLLSEQAEVNALRERETNARSVLSGLMGSSEAGTRAVEAKQKGLAENKKILAAYAGDLAKIYTDIQDKAYTRAKDEKDAFTTSAKDYLTRLEEKKKEAEEDIKLLAQSGFDFDAIKKSDPTTYNNFVKAAGGEEQLKALVTLNRKQEEVIDKQISGGKYIIAYRNPVTGKTRIESVDLGLPEGYKQVGDAGDRLLFAPENWDGDMSKVKSVAKGLTPTQAEKAGASVAGEYVPGADPVVDSWAKRIYDGVNKISDIPSSQAGLRNKVIVALQASGNDITGKPTVTEMGQAAKSTAQDLLNKLTSRKGTSAVGKSGLLSSFGYGLIPGTDRADFVTTFNSLKAQLSLDAVKYLKGQGQVSDAERALLSQAVTKLDLSQSEEEFKKTLEFIIEKLNGNVPAGNMMSDTASAPGAGSSIPAGTDGGAYGYPGYVSDGTQWVLKEE